MRRDSKSGLQSLRPNSAARLPSHSLHFLEIIADTVESLQGSRRIGDAAHDGPGEGACQTEIDRGNNDDSGVSAVHSAAISKGKVRHCEIQNTPPYILNGHRPRKRTFGSSQHSAWSAEIEKYIVLQGGAREYRSLRTSQERSNRRCTLLRRVPRLLIPSLRHLKQNPASDAPARQSGAGPAITPNGSSPDKRPTAAKTSLGVILADRPLDRRRNADRRQTKAPG